MHAALFSTPSREGAAALGEMRVKGRKETLNVCLGVMTELARSWWMLPMDIGTFRLQLVAYAPRNSLLFIVF